MTKLAPIQELDDKHCSETFNHAFKGEYSYEFTVPQLEALRQAIIRDFVSTLEPKLFHHEESGEHIFMNIVFGLPDETPLYDLSEWNDK